MENFEDYDPSRRRHTTPMRPGATRPGQISFGSDSRETIIIEDTLTSPPLGSPGKSYPIKVLNSPALSILEFKQTCKVDVSQAYVMEVVTERSGPKRKFREHQQGTAKYTGPLNSVYQEKEKLEAKHLKRYGRAFGDYPPQKMDERISMNVVDTDSSLHKMTGSRRVLDDMRYYAMFQLDGEDGTFYAQPVDDWTCFQPKVNYKTLNTEEAEEAYSRRDKTFNHFAVIVEKRLKDAQGGGENEDDYKPTPDTPTSPVAKGAANNEDEVIWIDSDSDDMDYDRHVTI